MKVRLYLDTDMIISHDEDSASRMLEEHSLNEMRDRRTYTPHKDWYTMDCTQEELDLWIEREQDAPYCVLFGRYTYEWVNDTPRQLLIDFQPCA